jgi:hypothetical protein
MPRNSFISVTSPALRQPLEACIIPVCRKKSDSARNENVLSSSAALCNSSALLLDEGCTSTSSSAPTSSAHSGAFPGQYRFTFVCPILPRSLSRTVMAASLTPAATDIVTPLLCSPISLFLLFLHMNPNTSLTSSSHTVTQLSHFFPQTSSNQPP